MVLFMVIELDLYSLLIWSIVYVCETCIFACFIRIFGPLLYCLDIIKVLFSVIHYLILKITIREQ